MTVPALVSEVVLPPGPVEEEPDEEPEDTVPPGFTTVSLPEPEAEPPEELPEEDALDELPDELPDEEAPPGPAVLPEEMVPEGPPPGPVPPEEDPFKTLLPMDAE